MEQPPPGIANSEFYNAPRTFALRRRDIFKLVESSLLNADVLTTTRKIERLMSERLKYDFKVPDHLRKSLQRLLVEFKQKYIENCYDPERFFVKCEKWLDVTIDFSHKAKVERGKKDASKAFSSDPTTPVTPSENMTNGNCDTDIEPKGKQNGQQIKNVSAAKSPKASEKTVKPNGAILKHDEKKSVMKKASVTSKDSSQTVVNGGSQPEPVKEQKNPERSNGRLTRNSLKPSETIVDSEVEPEKIQNGETPATDNAVPLQSNVAYYIKPGPKSKKEQMLKKQQATEAARLVRDFTKLTDTTAEPVLQLEKEKVVNEAEEAGKDTSAILKLNDVNRVTDNESSVQPVKTLKKQKMEKPQKQVTEDQRSTRSSFKLSEPIVSTDENTIIQNGDVAVPLEIEQAPIDVKKGRSTRNSPPLRLSEQGKRKIDDCSEFDTDAAVSGKPESKRRKLFHESTGKAAEKTQSFELQPPVAFTPNEALALIFDMRIPKNSYLELYRTTVEHFCYIYPQYPDVLQAKKQCSPDVNLIASDSNVEIKLQDLLNHTAKRILALKEKTIGSLEQARLNNITLKYNLGENNDFSRANNNYSLILMQPVQLLTFDIVTNENQAIWKNPIPKSTRCCRPMRIQFLNNDGSNYKNDIDHQVKNLKPHEVTIGDKRVYIKFELNSKDIDGNLKTSMVTSCNELLKTHHVGRKINQNKLVFANFMARSDPLISCLKFEKKALPSSKSRFSSHSQSISSSQADSLDESDAESIDIEN